MKIDAMLEWSAEERTAKEKEWRQALFTLKLQKATGQLDNPLKLREIRRDIARLKTLDHMDAAKKAKQAEHAAHETAAHAVAPMNVASTPRAATTEPAVKSEETVSSKGKKAAAAPKPKGKGGAKGKGAGVKTSGKKAAAPGKGSSLSKKKKTSPAGKAGSKSKSASKKKSK
jgi:large subunit ribosomal protein L29